MSTGLPGFDAVLQGVRPGDNIVFQVDSIDDYVPFVHPFCREARLESRALVYFRFAEHRYLLPEGVDAEVHTLRPEEGFENFISEIFDAIEKHGTGACYVFDCLSELSVDWFSDRMLGNFFMLTCPYLYDFETATFFALLKNSHMSVATSAIHNTAQVVLDVYRNREKLYIHPLKVYKRFSPTMYMLHSWTGDEFRPVKNSVVTSEILGHVHQPWLDFSVQRQDVWTRTFAAAHQCVEASRTGAPGLDEQTRDELLDRLLRMAVTREERLLQLARKCLTLADLIDIGRRMIGTGLIGGKSVGMLVARAILRSSGPQWDEQLEAHDSFFIGSDVFYTYLIVNNCWWVRRRLHRSGTPLDGADEVRQRLLSGAFPQEIRDQFMALLEYFGQSPIIVRSSSLLEDAYGNAFSGKYESVFLTNQGTPQQRLDEFIGAVREVYASTMKREALAYRAHWGLLEHDEQMALLVQRVSGSSYGNLFFPHVAGVAFSYNPYTWSSDIDPQQGMVRLVFGLGTRAVDRADDDYTRVVGLSAPLRRPESTFDEVRKYAQRKVDVLDLSGVGLDSRQFDEVVREAPDLPLDVFATQDEDLLRRAEERGRRNVFAHVLTFEHLLSQTPFVDRMKSMLSTLQGAYEYPVDVEFTANFVDGDDFRINLVQCRPFQAKREARTVEPPSVIDEADVALRTRGPIIGNSMAAAIGRLVYVVPHTYGQLPVNDRYTVARLVGKLTHAADPSGKATGLIVLVGPGRWGTSTPSLGVPVQFAEINGVGVICEIAAMHEGLVPDVSLGTHFFNDLVEMDMLYMAVYPEREGYVVNSSLLADAPNQLRALAPDAGAWEETVRVIDGANIGGGRRLLLHVDAVKQQGVVYVGSAECGVGSAE
jgi:hypothetical protein